MIKKLTQLRGVSGCEGEVAGFIKSHIKNAQVTEDVLGNITAFRKGIKSDKKVMLCAHMDEVGFIISHITKEGFLKFQEVGGFDARLLPGLRVLVGENKIPGTIGICPVHLTSAEDRKKKIKVSDLYIDAGGCAKDFVKIGDYVSLDSDYVEFGDGLFKARAIDDRAGCAALLELLDLDREYTFDLYVCFSVQEEAGLRGAKVLAQRIMPDIAVVAETTTCADLEGKSHEKVTVFGNGPAVSVIDGASYSINELRDMAFSVASENNIPIQLKTSTSGGNDGGAFQRVGAKSFVISLPTRYIHSPVSVASLKDFENYKKLIERFLERLDSL